MLRRFIPCVLSLAVVASGAACLGQAIEKLPTKKKPSTSPAPKPETLELLVTASPEPVPALKHRLVASPRHMAPGDSERYFLRAAILLQGSHVQARWQEYNEAGDEGGWLDGPMQGEKLKQAKQWISGMPIEPVVSELRRGAMQRRNSLRMDFGDLSLDEMYSVLLPEVQEMRSVARLLDVDIRIAIAERDYERAIERIGLGYRLATAFSDSDFLVCRLVGAAIASVMTGAARDLSAAPDAPNLYWALATLPRPLMPVGSSARVELENIKTFLADELKGVGERTPEQWTEKLVDVAERLDRLAGGSEPTDRAKLALVVTAGLTLSYPQAKQGLQRMGCEAERIKAMSAAEAVLRWADFEVRRLADEMQKWTLLPRAIRAKHVDKGMEAFELHVAQNKKALPGVIAGMLMPGVTQAMNAETRLQMQVDLLQTAEAIRAHAAAHDGQLPKSLDTMGPLPALPNPRTGQPFGYRVEQTRGGPVAVLLATDSDVHWNNQVLRIRIR